MASPFLTSRLILFLFGVSLAFSSSLDIQSLVKITEARSLAIGIAHDKYDIAQSRIGQAWSTVFPKVELTSSYSKAQNYLTPFIGSSAQKSLGLTGTQVLFNVSAMAAVFAGNDALKVAIYELEKVREGELFKVISTFLTVLKIEKNIEVLRESTDQLTSILERVEVLKANGMATRIDVLRTKSKISEVNVSIIQLRTQLFQLKNQLSYLVNKDISKAVIEDHDINDIYNKNIKVTPISLENILSERPDYLTLKYTHALLNSNVLIQQGASWPTLVATGTFGYSTTGQFELTEDNKEWSFALAGGLNIFNLGDISGKVNQAEAEVRVVAKQMQQYEQFVESEVNHLKYMIDATKAKVLSLEEEESLLKETFSLIETRYHVGEVTNLELIDAQNKLSSVRQSVSSAKIDYVVELIKWMKATGQLVPFLEKGDLK
jgi:outer membrane protein TolC